MRNFTILFLFFTFQFSAQNVRLGTYELTEQLMYTGIQLTDSGFLKTTAHVLNHGGNIAKGTFEVNGDTLILKSEPWEGMNSRFEILTQSDSIKPEFGTYRKLEADFLNISGQIVNESDEPVPVSIIGLRSASGELIATVLSDEGGKFSYWNGNGLVVSLTIGSLVHRPLNLDLEQFMDTVVTLKIILKLDDSNSYNTKSFTERYLIGRRGLSLTHIGPDSPGTSLNYRMEHNKR